MAKDVPTETVGVWTQDMGRCGFLWGDLLELPILSRSEAPAMPAILMISRLFHQQLVVWYL